MTSTQPQIEYTILSPAERATETGRALQEAQRALTTARQALAAHEAQTPTNPDAWGDVWAQLSGRVKAHERMAEQAERAHQQAQAAYRQQQQIDYRVGAKRKRAAHEQAKATIRGQMETLVAQMRTLADEAAAEDQRFREEWEAHARSAAQLGISSGEFLVFYRHGPVYAVQINYYEFHADGNKVLMH